jgi:sRNA-binding protein
MTLTLTKTPATIEKLKKKLHAMNIPSAVVQVVASQEIVATPEIITSAKEEVREVAEAVVSAKPVVAKPNKVKRKKRLPFQDEQLVLYELLNKHYPLCIDFYNLKPFKLKIREDLYQALPLLLPDVTVEELEIHGRNLNRILGFLCRQINYLKTFEPNAPRYKLDGTIEGVVTEQQATRAKKQLTSIFDSMRKKAVLKRENEENKTIEFSQEQNKTNQE